MAMQRSYRCNSIQVDGNNLRFAGDLYGGFSMTSPLTFEKSYFEVKFLNVGNPHPWCTIGLVPDDYNLNDELGWFAKSIGLRDKGSLRVWRNNRSEEISQENLKYNRNDIIGCGIKRTPNEPRCTEVYFTNNGKQIYRTTINNSEYESGFYPAVGLGLKAEAKILIWPDDDFFEKYLERMSKIRNLEQRCEQISGNHAQKVLIKYYPSADIEAVPGNEGFLGRGGFGCVRMAFTKSLGVVAVKCFSVFGGRDDVQQKEERLTKELELIVSSSHVNVMRVEGFTSWSGAMGILLEYMPGDLCTFLLYKIDDRFRIPRIPALIKLRICTDVASGITFLHHGFAADQRITHGDIKPENILLTANLRCKVGDFGAAELATVTGSTMSTVEQRFREQTLVYSAPERLQDPQLQTKRAMDVFSFSMTMRATLVRKHPNMNAQGEMRVEDYVGLIRERQYRPPLDDVEDIKASLTDDADVAIIDLLKDEIVKCWEHNPDERPSMMDVRDRLLQCLSTKDQSVIAQHVADITKHMDIKLPCRQQYACAPIQCFVAPHFDSF
ncbi:unnamed protein product [Clavelina lepadiformis]|uniref:Protein kinase domain-containing protein n=1 Tax=Clavelina lepadiformis TaxID=159417 RepID=A0ABP0EZY2_CLALP